MEEIRCKEDQEKVITIRRAKEEDAHRLFEINDKAFGYYYPEEKTKQRLEEILKSQNNCILVACEKEQVIGYIHGVDYECIYADSLKNIMALAVDEAYRGLGIGRKLLEGIEAWAKETGCEGIRLVSGFNREKAHEFYLHCGYALRKDQKNFIKHF